MYMNFQVGIVFFSLWEVHTKKLHISYLTICMKMSGKKVKIFLYKRLLLSIFRSIVGYFFQKT